MLPVCSATSSRSHPQILFPGSWRPCSPFLKDFVSRCNVENTNSIFGKSTGTHLHKIIIKTQATKSFCSNITERIEESVNKDLFRQNYGTSDISNSSGAISESCSFRSGKLIYVESSSLSPMEEGQKDFADLLNENLNGKIASVNPQTILTLDVPPKNSISLSESPNLDKGSFSIEPLTENINSRVATVKPKSLTTVDVSPENSISLPESSNLNQGSFSSEPLTENLNGETAPVDTETISTIDISSENFISLPESPNLDQESFFNAKASFEDFFSGVKDSFSSSLNKGENSVKNTLDSISSSITSIKQSASQAVNDAVGRVFSTAHQTGDLAGNKFSSFSSDLKEASSKVTAVAVDLLRQTVIGLENSVSSGASFLVYSYGSAKELLPSDIKITLDLYEDAAIKVLKPVGSALEQVYIAIEGVERSIGLDPDDPIINFVLFLGTSGTFWVLYRLWVYGGYAGDLSPKAALELLMSREKSMLVDVRPEDLREKDGVPDLRRTARFRYASVTLPEVGGPVRKMLKSGREVDDVLTAAVIKNLKAVQDRSKVIVMDADGARSKGIARALRKIGIKKPYLVHGGFKSWIKEGLRIKELKRETALSILNQEAEAILEEINPSPLQVVGVGVGLVAGLYTLLEWEKALQLVGVFGLCQSIYRRVASYGNVEDFKQDMRQLLGPVRLGAQAFSWAAGKLESNRIGLPTSPSSSDVQSRVLQAAAKHESQPSDSDPLTDGIAPVNESVDLSEA